jgi:hypothetical protein
MADGKLHITRIYQESSAEEEPGGKMWNCITWWRAINAQLTPGNLQTADIAAVNVAGRCFRN